jgi:hypothetical protein
MFEWKETFHAQSRFRVRLTGSRHEIDGRSQIALALNGGRGDFS